MKKQTVSGKKRSSRPAVKREVPSGTGLNQLQELVREHGVCWDIWPEYHVDRGGKPVQIGFEFSLIGASHHSERIVEPGCPECMKVYQDLHRIAEGLIPPEKQNGSYDIVIADAAPHYSSQRRFKPEVLQVIRVIHREGFDNSMDACEVACLMEMKERAEKLGVPKTNGVHS